MRVRVRGRVRVRIRVRVRVRVIKVIATASATATCSKVMNNSLRNESQRTKIPLTLGMAETIAVSHAAHCNMDARLYFIK